MVDTWGGCSMHIPYIRMCADGFDRKLRKFVVFLQNGRVSGAEEQN